MILHKYGNNINSNYLYVSNDNNIIIILNILGSQTVSAENHIMYIFEFKYNTIVPITVTLHWPLVTYCTAGDTHLSTFFQSILCML